MKLNDIYPFTVDELFNAIIRKPLSTKDKFKCIENSTGYKFETKKYFFYMYSIIDGKMFLAKQAKTYYPSDNYNYNFISKKWENSDIDAIIDHYYNNDLFDCLSILKKEIEAEKALENGL